MLLNRIKSFLWRLGGFLLASGLVWISDNIGLLEISTFATTIIGLVIGEVTKYLNTSTA